MPTVTLDRLQIVNGRIDACQLVTETEVKNVLGTKVSIQAAPFERATACRFVTADRNAPVALLTVIHTDATLREAGTNITAVKYFENQRKADLNLFKQLKGTIQDVPGIGDTAYFTDLSMINLYILKNGVHYTFSSSSPQYGGMGSIKALTELAKLAMQRVP